MGKQKDLPGGLPDDEVAGFGGRQPDHDEHEQRLEGQVGDCPRRLAPEVHQRRVARRQRPPGSEAVGPRSGADRHAEHDHAQCGSPGEHPLLGPGQQQVGLLVASHRSEDQVGGDHDDVVQQRCGRRQQEPVAGIEQRCGHSVDQVQHHLRQKQPQELGAQGDRSLPCDRFADPAERHGHDLRGQHDADGGDHPEDHRSVHQYRAGQLVGLAPVIMFQLRHDLWHQHRLKRTGGQQLIEDVRDVVGRLVDVVEQRGAEHVEHDPDADEPGQPADQRHRRHPGGRTGQVGAGGDGRLGQAAPLRRGVSLIG